MRPAIKATSNPPRAGIPLSVQAATALIVGPLPQQVPLPTPANSGKGKRNRCAFCPRAKNTKYSPK